MFKGKQEEKGGILFKEPSIQEKEVRIYGISQQKPTHRR